MSMVIDRFWAKVQKTPECWEWTAAKTHGYGYYQRIGKSRRAHCISFELHYGSIPDGMFVCHSCDNPGCVNPDHLFLGTPADNTRDMIAKGRHRGQLPGSSHTHSKLTDADVVAIRSAEGVTQKRLAERYGIDQGQISRIRAGRVWTHLAVGNEQ
jgi:hypothetical protein